MSESIERAINVYTQLVDQGVAPEYARVQVKHSAERLGQMEPDALAADILGNTPHRYITKRAEPEAAAPPYDPVADGLARGKAQRERYEHPLGRR